MAEQEALIYEECLNSDDAWVVREAREFGEAYFTDENISRWYAQGGIPYEVMEAYRTSPLGYLGFLPERGGPAMSFLAQVAAIDELTRIAGATLPFQSQFLDFTYISALANDDQLHLVLDKYKETSRLCFCTAISDSISGSDLYGLKTCVRETKDGLVLSGEKAFVTNGLYTPYILVFARDCTRPGDTQKTTFSYWLIPATLEGIKRVPISQIGQKMLPAAAITFEDVHIEPEWRLPREPFRPTLSIPNLGRCGISAGSSGLARAAYEDVARYASSYQIGNTRLAEFQQIGLMLTEMASKLVSIEAHISRACKRLETEADATLDVAIMKYYVSQAAFEIADAAMQIFGGAGYTGALRISRIWADVRGNRYAGGTEQVMANMAARRIMDNFASA